jgi:hypothetical protein
MRELKTHLRKQTCTFFSKSDGRQSGTGRAAGGIWRRMGDVFYGLMPIDQEI